MIVNKSAVITPAAHDEASRRGITIERSLSAPTNKQQSRSGNGEYIANIADTTAKIIDRTNPDRAIAVGQQLNRRGIELGLATVILSETPASDLYEQIAGGNRAAMVTQVGDVQRFGNELNPSVWVLDMKRLNIPAAVNTVAMIAKQGALQK